MLSFPTLGLGASELRGLGIATATLVVTASTAFAQNTLTVKGVVKDTKGEALIGVNVRVKGTSQGASTDIDGKFSISGVARNAVLEVSYVGMQTLTVPVNGQTQHSITLKDDSNQLSDVVVVGYTTQRRESLTGSMLNIKSDKLKDITSPSVENLLNGKAPGVYVAPGSGQPGSSGAVVIRGQATLSGTTQPLWVIDGVIVGSNAPYDEAGKLVPHRYSGWVNGAASNYLYDLQWNHGEGMHYELMGNLDFDIKLKDWLTLSSVNNVKYTHTDNHGYQDPHSNAGKNVDGRITEYSSEMIRRYTNQKILINKSWAAHRLDALLAYEYNDYRVMYYIPQNAINAYPGTLTQNPTSN